MHYLFNAVFSSFYQNVPTRANDVCNSIGKYIARP